jgi:predicted Rossmann fold flavoprotein
MNKSFDVLVLGAGAAGMMCAAVAGQRGRKVLLLDHAEKLARKFVFLVAGAVISPISMRGQIAIFRKPAFLSFRAGQFGPQDFIAIVERHGIAYHEKNWGSLFCDDSSQQIIDMLDAECSQAGCPGKWGSILTRCVRLRLALLWIPRWGASVQPRLWWQLVACPSANRATPLGYRIAEQFGLPVTSLSPALVPLTFHVEDAEAFAPLAGVSLDVEVRAGKGRFREQVLFTHKGLSGPAILQISSYWEPGMDVVINLLPDCDVQAFLDERQGSEQLLSNALAELGWPKRFAEAWLARLGFNVRLKDLSPKSASWRSRYSTGASSPMVRRVTRRLR